MFIVWRRRLITSDRRAELFATWLSGHKYTGATAVDAPAWTPLYCDHTGPGRRSLIPCLMHSERRGGQPRQELVRRLHAARTCCLRDPFFVAAWWHAFDQEDAYAKESADGVQGQFWARDRAVILAKLREVVPRAKPAGVRAFTAYRLAKEAEQEQRQKEVDEALHQQREEQERRREAEAERARQAAEEFRRQLDELEERIRRAASGGQQQQRQQEQQQERRQEGRRSGGTWGAFAWGQRGPHWSEVLGVPRTATLDQVKARWRELALRHHPDRGGDPTVFVPIQAAFEKAMEELRHAG